MTTLFKDNNQKYIFPSNENKQFKNTGVGFSTQKIIKDIEKELYDKELSSIKKKKNEKPIIPGPLGASISSSLASSIPAGVPGVPII